MKPDTGDTPVPPAEGPSPSALPISSRSRCSRETVEAMPTLMVFGGAGDAVLLGAYALEGFSLAADPVNRRLVRVRGLAMGASVPLL